MLIGINTNNDTIPNYYIFQGDKNLKGLYSFSEYKTTFGM